MGRSSAAIFAVALALLLGAGASTRAIAQETSPPAGSASDVLPTRIIGLRESSA